MARLLSSLLLIGVLGAATAFVAAPGVAFFAVRSAAGAQDIQGLSQLVDFAAVRASLQPQIATDPAAVSRAVPRGPWWRDPLGAFRRQVDPVTSAPSLDPLLTPAALYGLTLGEGRSAVARSSENDVTRQAGRDAPLPRLRYWGVNRARFAVPPRGTLGETVFTFERRGAFEWRLVHIGLPPRRTAGPASRS